MSRRRRNHSRSELRGRRLRVEQLEDRRMLAVFMVSNLDDAGSGSLRDAVIQANSSIGPDTVEFAAGLSGGTISLSTGEMEITEALAIDARPLAANMTIDANELSRIFNITADTGDFTLGGLTLTGGRTTAAFKAGRGGAILSATTGNLTLDQSTVSGNSTAGSNADGGGIFSSGTMSLTQSTVSGNSTTGINVYGGGLFSGGAVMLTHSIVSGNSTSGSNGGGGGIFSFGAVTLTQSIVSGNSTSGSGAEGGGIRTIRALTLNQSTVSGNTTTGTFADGGGIFSQSGALTLNQSTVTENHATHATATGGGVFQRNSTYNHPFSISGSIVAGNTAGGGRPDLVKDPQSTLTVNYSLIGVPDGLTFAGNVGNLTGTAASPLNPQLGPLANNGGPTQTHALLAGSPAIDMGDPSFMVPPNFDQRGFAYSRVIGGRSDMGAFEFAAVSADFNEDGSVDGLDFLAWQLGFGITAPNAVKGDGDADDDQDVDADDLAAWENAYGAEGVAPLAALSQAAGIGAVVGDDTAHFGTLLQAELVDLAIEMDRPDAAFEVAASEFLAEEAAPEVFRLAIAEFHDAPRRVAGDFGGIATSRTAVDDSCATQLEDELVVAQI